MDNSEIELKMVLDPADMEKLRRHPSLSSSMRGQAETKLQESVYFDTPDLALRAAGVVLRVRHQGNRRIQTVKTADQHSAGLFARKEWECDIEGDQPRLDLLPATEAGPIFADPRLASQLAPIFTTIVTRTTYQLGADGWQVELALDEGDVVAGDKREPICEMELELKAGPPSRMFDLALSLHQDIPGRLSSVTKSDRGFALSHGIAPKPAKALPLPLASSMTVAQAFQHIARSCIHHLLANEDALLQARDPEAIHQMRVALRRFRSALGLFKELVATPQLETIKAELKWVLSHLGPARDIDVFIAEILEPVSAPFPDERGLTALCRDFATQKAQRYDNAITTLTAPRFTALILSLGAWIEGGEWLTGENWRDRPLLSVPVRGFAQRELGRRDAKVRKDGKKLRKLSPEQRHRLRIRTKKLRYAGEFFASLFSERKARKYLAELSDLQDHLGKLNDINVSRQMLASTGERPGAQDRLWAAGLVAGWHAARSDGLLDEALLSWRRYRKRGRFWRS